jgi:hypothetical protein
MDSSWTQVFGQNAGSDMGLLVALRTNGALSNSRYLELRRGGGTSSTAAGGLLFSTPYESNAHEPTLLCVHQERRLIRQINSLPVVNGDTVLQSEQSATDDTNQNDVLNVFFNGVLTSHNFVIDAASSSSSSLPNVFSKSPVSMSRQTRFDVTPSYEENNFGQAHVPHVASISEVINFRTPRIWSS